MTKNLTVVAIVDDDPSVLRALSRLLDTWSLAARTFQSGAQFLASLVDGRPDCLILDLQMPGMTGLEIQRHLAREGIQIPTIVITAHGDPEMRARCEAAGAIACLPKPVSSSSLFAAIETATGIPASN
jgi:FixJ family two-component response regulator